MSKLDRRTLVTGLAVAGGALASGRVNAAPAIVPLASLKKEAEVACLYHCDFGEPNRFQQMLNNIGNHYSVYGADPFAIQLAIVAHSAGIKFFLEKVEGTPWKAETLAPAIFETVENLAKNGLKVFLCDITFERLKIDRELAHKSAFIQFVPSGVATVAALQSKGFAYLKTG